MKIPPLEMVPKFWWLVTSMLLFLLSSYMFQNCFFTYQDVFFLSFIGMSLKQGKDLKSDTIVEKPNYI